MIAQMFGIRYIWRIEKITVKTKQSERFFYDVYEIYNYEINLIFVKQSNPAICKVCSKEVPMFVDILFFT